MASTRCACVCATTLCETSLFSSPRQRRRELRLLPLGARVEIVSTEQQQPSSSSALDLVQVRVGEAEDGWVQRGHLRIKCTAVRRSSSRRLAPDGTSGLGRHEWSKPFFFMQLADSQLGMAETFPTQPPGWDREEAMLRRAIADINRLRPAFAIVCGDLVNDYPGQDGSESDLRARQTFDFQLACEMVDPTIPLVCVCGNHDVGNRPTAESIALYKRVFGDDYFAFTIHGVRCIVLNSQLFKDASGAEKQAAEQWRWLRDELAKKDTAAARHVLCFCHVPPFINAPDEPSAYFNLDVAVRDELLSLLASHGVIGCFCGHYHRNAGGIYYPLTGTAAAASRGHHASQGRPQPLEVVVTGACGVNVTTRETGSPLEIAGMGGAREVVEDISGMRLVQLGEEGMAHRWYTFRELAKVKPDEVMDPLAVANERDAADDGGRRPSKKSRVA